MDALKNRQNSDLVFLKCPIHNYFGIASGAPTPGCITCAKTQILTILATKKGDMNENLSELESILHAAVELAQEGKFDFKPSPPKFEITKSKETT